ncbi:ArsR family transcriptional regulator [Paenibacillus yonginensis]|uniref:ArsR family transcriptional regulator n=1 Tax=Paenibacillus yonginensis TaxID=1462996 RepID=A0A1B1MX94_9BACL|nr:metalloregulator ArsR/SmtB family transcription factor [Paenibacillus yonginensis]ANS73785.1 ArsR family transcriptional regulator [Paenibacillus yonginensis]
MKLLFHPKRNEIELSSVLQALSDPIRLNIVAEIQLNGEKPCSYFEVPIAKSTMSHHLRTLREAGVVFVRRQGTQRFISIRTKDLEDKFPGLLHSILNAFEVSSKK